MKRKIITIKNDQVSIPSSGEIWMSQWELADLFECYTAKINANIRAILKTDVLREADVTRMYQYGNGNFVQQYNLEMIIALSFRIGSRNAEIFRTYIVGKSVKNEDATRFIVPLHIIDINNLN